MPDRVPRLVVGLILAGLMGLLTALSQRPGEAAPRLAAAAQTGAAQSLAAQAGAPVLPPPEPVSTSLGYVGAAGCAASNCHGGNRAREGVHFSAYNIWVQRDPHAQAYEVLFNDLSTQIAQRLQLAVPAHQARECLSCHSMVKDVSHFPADQHFKLADGVSCEGCHGPAERWLEPHRSAAWKDPAQWPEARKAATGFLNTKNLETRARVCAECHVGAAGGRDVNHDLIAAGHPRLDYEFAAYHANLPRHWDRARDKARHEPVLEARLWVAGQVATAQAAVELLQSRAASPQAPWPEFSEYSCFACHHDLHEPSWRQQRQTLGELPWGTWHFAALPAAVDVLAPARVESLQAATAGLRSLMEQRQPDRQQVQEAAGRLARELDTLAGSLARDPHLADKLPALLARFSNPDALPEYPDWDTAAQVYLALVALRQGEREGRGISVRDPLLPHFEQLRGQLRFPRGDNSPRHFRQDEVQAVRSEFRRIHELIAHE